MDPGVRCRLIGGPHMEGKRRQGSPVSDVDLDVNPRERHVQPRRVGHISVRGELKDGGHHLRMPEGQETRHPAVGDLIAPGDAIGEVLNDDVAAHATKSDIGSTRGTGLRGIPNCGCREPRDARDHRPSRSARMRSTLEMSDPSARWSIRATISAASPVLPRPRDSAGETSASQTGQTQTPRRARRRPVTAGREHLEACLLYTSPSPRD